MFSNRHSLTCSSIRRASAPVLMAATAVLASASQAADVEHQTLEIEDVLGIPAIQAQIVACLGEEVYFTGTVRITTKDGVATHINWGGMTGETADGDRFMGGSAVNVGQQSSQTLTEVGAGKDRRQFHIHTVKDVVLVTCK